MTADRKWVERNLGFDPISTPPPAASFTVKRVAASAVKRSAKVAPEDFQREIIDFDSEAPEGREFVAFSTATGLSRFTDIPWPKGLAPQTGPKPKGTGGGPLLSRRGSGAPVHDVAIDVEHRPGCVAYRRQRLAQCRSSKGLSLPDRGQRFRMHRRRCAR